MHKELKPRSMSETGHLPTDVESSDRDPGAATLQSGPYPALTGPSPFYLALLSVSLLLAPDTSEPSDSPHREPLSATPSYVNPVFSTCLWTSSGSLFSSSTRSDARSEKDVRMYFKVFNLQDGTLSKALSN